MPLLHEYLFLIRHCWTVLCDERQDWLIFFAFLLKSKLSVLKFYLWECRHNQSFWISSVDKFYSKMLDSAPELEFVRRSLNASPLMKLFWPLRKCLYWCCSRFEMRFYFQYRILCESFAFEDICVKERSFSVWSVSRNLYNPVVVVCFSNELRDFDFVCLPTWEYISSIYLFQTSGLRALRLRISICFYRSHKAVGRGEIFQGHKFVAWRRFCKILSAAKLSVKWTP